MKGRVEIFAGKSACTFLLAALVLLGCDAPATRTASMSSDTTTTPNDTVRTGAAVLAEDGFARLRGQRVGLIVNHTARVDTVHLIDLIDEAPDVTLAALFGPEHGLRGQAGAGEHVASDRDPKTGVPIFSLYGERRKPTAEMLENVDVLVFDIQDIGARFYTYISTMGLTMQAAAEHGVPFLVLDRPNPLGGNHVSGFVLDTTHRSFVGQYPIPVQHGLTVGELARMIQGEAWLDGLDALQLDVVPAQGWARAEQWPETHLPWRAPSPNIPDYETALIYPGAAFFEATAASEGRGTPHPFKLIGAPWADGQTLADTLNARDLPGVRFEAATFTPESNKLQGEQLEGIRHVITDADAYQPVATGVHVLHAFYHQAPSAAEFLTRPEWLAKLAGTERFLEMLRAGRRPEAIIKSWEPAITQFREDREAYLIY